MGTEKPKGKRVSKLKPCCDGARLLLDHVQKHGLRGMARTLEIDPARLSRLITGANAPTYEERRLLEKHCSIEPWQWDDDAQGQKTEAYAKVPIRHFTKHLSGVSDQHLYLLRLFDECEARTDYAIACLARALVTYDDMAAICEVVAESFSPASSASAYRNPATTMKTWLSGAAGKRAAAKYSLTLTEWRYLIEKIRKNDILARAALDLGLERRRGGAYVESVFAELARRSGKRNVVDQESTWQKRIVSK